MAPSVQELVINFKASDMTKKDVLPFVISKAGNADEKRVVIDKIVLWSKNDKCPDDLVEKLKDHLPDTIQTSNPWKAKDVHDIYYELALVFKNVARLRQWIHFYCRS